MIKQRLLQLFENKGIKNANEFAKILNYASSEKISRLLRDADNMPSADILKDIANKFVDIDLNWLLTGKGSMIKNIDTTHENIVLEPIIKLKKEKGIPLIPIEAMAGLSNGDTTTLELECEHYFVPDFKNKADYLIRISGNSMAPKYYNGDIVA